MILVPTMGFSGTPDIVVWPERTLGHCTVGKIQDGRRMFKVKQYIDIIFYRIEADSLFWFLPWNFRHSGMPRNTL